jgi:hypothetical protein
LALPTTDGATFFALVGEYFHVEVVLPPGQDNISIHRMVPRAKIRDA